MLERRVRPRLARAGRAAGHNVVRAASEPGSMIISCPAGWLKKKKSPRDIDLIGGTPKQTTGTSTGRGGGGTHLELDVIHRNRKKKHLDSFCLMQQIMKDRWINAGFEDDDLKPYVEPELDITDQKRIGTPPKKIFLSTHDRQVYQMSYC